MKISKNHKNKFTWDPLTDKVNGTSTAAHKEKEWLAKVQRETSPHRSGGWSQHSVDLTGTNCTFRVLVQEVTLCLKPADDNFWQRGTPSYLLTSYEWDRSCHYFFNAPLWLCRRELFYIYTWSRMNFYKITLQCIRELFITKLTFIKRSSLVIPAWNFEKFSKGPHPVTATASSLILTALRNTC